MKLFNRIITLLGIIGISVPVLVGAVGIPTIALNGAQDIKQTEALVAVAYNSHDADYEWSAQPKVSVTYTNLSSGQVMTAGPIGESGGSRTTLFGLHNLVPDTSYSYYAVMNYKGALTQTAALTFKTLAPSSITIIGEDSTPTGTPAFTLSGVEGITTNEALVAVAYDSHGAEYSWTNQPRLSVSYTNQTDGNVLTTASLGESMGSRTTLFRLRDLEPNTKYIYKAVLFYAGNRLETDEQQFTTKKVGSDTYAATPAPAETSTTTTVKSPTTSLFPGTASVSKTIGGSKTSNALESIVKTGGYGTKNGVSLGITDSHARVVSGENFDYTIQYYNGKKTALRSARIVVQLPDQYVFDQGDGNTVYSNNTNVVTIYLGTVASEESGTVTFKAKALAGENNGVETKAVLIYTGGSVAAIDTDTYVGGSQSVLGATVFGSGFFPQTFFGWMIIIIIFIIIMIIARRYLSRTAKVEEEKK